MLLQLVRENERMKATLRNIAAFAASSTFGGWRQRVYDMAMNALRARAQAKGGE